MENTSTNRRRFLGLAGSAAASTVLAGCSGGGSSGSGDKNQNDNNSRKTGTPIGNESATSGSKNDSGSASEEFAVTITQSQMPQGLDPQNHSTTTVNNVLLQAYESLVDFNSKGKIIQKLATNYERIEKGRARFTIREGVTFHNGHELTPEDIAYSINRIVKNDVGITSPQKSGFNIVGAEVVDDERAVDVLSDEANPIVFRALAVYQNMMEKSWVENHTENEINKNVNGTGPFQLKNYEQDVKLVYTRYEDYWNDPADISQLTFNASKESSTRVNQLLENETDLVTNVPPQSVKKVRSAKNTSISAAPSTRMLFAQMRYDVEPFSSPKFRQAMNYAINLKGIVENVLSGFGAPTSQPTLEGFFGYNDDIKPYPQDKKKAESLVEESGFAGAEITFDTPVGRYLKDVEIAQAVVSQIDSLSNVSCSLNQRDFNALLSELAGDLSDFPHFFLIGWGNTMQDASRSIIPNLTTEGAYSAYSNEKLDSLMQKAQSTTDEDERKSYLEKANALCHEQAPLLYLNRQYSVYGVSNRIDWTARSDERIVAYEMSRAN